jgi:phosphomannomutase
LTGSLPYLATAFWIYEREAMRTDEKTLMVSIAGIRGVFGRGLDAAVIVRYAGAFGTWSRRRAAASGNEPLVVVGRDGRVTGPVCSRLVTATLQSTGCHVLDAGMATTPTVEMAVEAAGASGGIILSSSHNPADWNALKLLNEHGEFLTRQQGAEVIALAESDGAETVPYDALGS